MYIVCGNAHSVSSRVKMKNITQTSNLLDDVFQVKRMQVKVDGLLVTHTFIHTYIHTFIQTNTQTIEACLETLWRTHTHHTQFIYMYVHTYTYTYSNKQTNKQTTIEDSLKTLWCTTFVHTRTHSQFIYIHILTHTYINKYVRNRGCRLTSWCEFVAFSLVWSFCRSCPRDFQRWSTRRTTRSRGKNCTPWWFM